MDAVFEATEARRVAAELRQLIVNADVVGVAASMLDDYAASLSVRVDLVKALEAALATHGNQYSWGPIALAALAKVAS